jgi:hypothetical protein
MAYTASLNEENRFIEISYRGRVHAPEVKSALTAREHLAREHAIHDHLIECSHVEELPTICDLFWIAESLRSILKTPIHRVAMIVPSYGKLNADLHFFATAAYNRGVKIELFLNRQQAESYLTAP